MKSMTGFGECNRQTPSLSVSMQCRSVNHRNLDVRLFLPPSLHAQEIKLTKIVKSFFRRGRIEFRIEIENSSARFSEHHFSEAHAQLSHLSDKFSMPPPTLADVFSLHQKLGTKVQPDFDVNEIEDDVRTCCENLLKSRIEEGDRLEPVLRSYIETIASCVSQVKAYSANNPELIFQKLSNRLHQQTSGLGVDSVSEERLAQELILYIDKSDISEEIQRIESHIKGVRSLIDGDLPECGKKLDFYMQEFIREANTIGSKTNLAQITDEVVTMKVTIEKIREQAANIE